MPTYTHDVKNNKLDRYSDYTHNRQFKTRNFILIRWSMVDQIILVHTTTTIASYPESYLVNLEEAYYNAIDYYDSMANVTANPESTKRYNKISTELLNEVITLTDG